MDKATMLRIARDEQIRFKVLKKSCDTCIPDELIEWIDAVILLIEKDVSSV